MLRETGFFFNLFLFFPGEYFQVPDVRNGTVSLKVA